MCWDNCLEQRYKLEKRITVLNKRIDILQMQLGEACKQNYCTICGNILDSYKPKEGD